MANISSYENPEIAIYPNPSSGELTVESGKVMAKIELINSLGKIEFSNQVNTKQTKLNLNNVRSGLYFIDITYMNGDSVVERVIKE